MIDDNSRAAAIAAGLAAIHSRGLDLLAQQGTRPPQASSSYRAGTTLHAADVSALADLSSEARSRRARYLASAPGKPKLAAWLAGAGVDPHRALPLLARPGRDIDPDEELRAAGLPALSDP